MSSGTLLGMCGSLRAASSNRMLMHEAARLYGPEQFIEGDLRLPLFDEDLEDQGMPAAVQMLSDQIAAADAVVIACPEYNKALSGVMKNALDWISRTSGSPWRDKPVAIMSAAGGRAGGQRSQFSLRLCMVAFRPRVLPGPEVLVAGANKAFDADGRLIDARDIGHLTELMDDLRRIAAP